MGAQSSEANQEQSGLSSDVEKLQSQREQVTGSVARVLRQHLLDNMGELGSVRAIPAVSQQFVDLLCQSMAAQIDEQDWNEQVRDLARRGLGPKAAVALIDTLHDELQTRLGDGDDVTSFAHRYRLKFLDAYMQARQSIVVADHESIHKSLTLTLETRLNREQTLRVALEQERVLALRRAEALAAVAQINLEIATVASEESLLQTAVTLTNRHFQLYHTHIYLLDEAEEQLVLAASAGEAADQLLAQNHAIPLSRQESLAVRAAQARRALVIHDTRDGTGFLPNPLMSETRSAVAAPLIARDRLFGVLNIQSAQPDYFTEDDINIQAALAVQIATALYNARSFEQVKLQADIIESAATAIVTADLDGVLVHANGKALELFGAAEAKALMGRPATDFWDEEEAALLQEVGIPAVWHSDSWRYEMTLHALDGRTIPVDVTLFLVRDADGRPLRLAAYLVEITERKEAEKIQQQLTASLERQLDEINALQRAMSHQGWQAFMTAKERPIQGYRFAQDNLLPVSRQELTAEAWPVIAPDGRVSDGNAAVMPITARDVAIGALAVRRPSGEPLGGEQQQLLADISNSVAEALERARLFEEAEISREQAEHALSEAQRRTAELAVINKIVTKLGSSLDMQTSMQVVADGLAEALDVEQVRVTLLDESKEYLTILAEHFNPDVNESMLGVQLPLKGNKLTRQVIQTHKPVQITDVAHDPRVAPVRDLLLEQGILQLFILPMLSGKEVIGTVGIDILEENQTLTADQMQLAETIVSQAATAIQSSRLFTQIEKRAAELAAINAVSEAASSHLDLATLAETMGPMLQETFHTDTLYIAYYDDKSGMIEFPYYHSYEDSRVAQPPRKLDENSGFTGKIIQTCQPLLFIPTAKELEEALEESRRQGAQLTGSGGAVPTSYLGAPMIVGEEIVGVIGMNTHDDMKIFDEADKQLLVTLARTIGVAAQNARSFKESRERAEELAVINQVAEVVAQQLEMDQLFTAVHEQIQRAVVNDTFYFAIYNKEQNQFDFPYFFDEERKYNVTSLAFDPAMEIGKVFTSGKPVILNRTPEQQKEKAKKIRKKLLGKGKMPTNVIFVPLRIGSEIIGVLSAQNYQFREYTLSDQTLLSGIANHVAVALENVRLFTETQKRAERERLVNEINQKIQSTTSVESALQMAVQELGKAFGAKHTAVQLSLAPKKDPENGANGSAKRKVRNGS